MPVSESKKKANAKWDKTNMATLACKVKKHQAAAFKDYAAQRGKTSNTMLKEYVLDCIGEGETVERDKANAISVIDENRTGNKSEPKANQATGRPSKAQPDGMTLTDDEAEHIYRRRLGGTGQAGSLTLTDEEAEHIEKRRRILTRNA